MGLYKKKAEAIRIILQAVGDLQRGGRKIESLEILWEEVPIGDTSVICPDLKVTLQRRSRMCKVSFKNHGRGNRYYDVVCNGQLIQRFHGASAKSEANAMCDNLNKTYGV